MSKEIGVLPVYKDLIEIVRQRQLELTTKRGRVLTLTEVSNELIRNGLIYTED